MTVLVETTLRDGRDLVVPALRQAVKRLDPTNQAIADYHLGWTDIDGRPSESSGGKAIRPALALLSARAVGAPASAAVPGAVAVELAHNFSLIHDDLMDGDTRRRHRPTVWATWGVGAAILAGDAMLTCAQQVLLDLPQPAARTAARLLADSVQELVRGQVEDLQFEGRASIGVDECLRMAAGKTGALLSASAAIGAVLVSADAASVEALAEFGRQFGLAFQLVDDLLGIWGDPEQTGKPVLSDLRTRKKSLPVAYALSANGPAARELLAWLSAPMAHGEPELHRAADLVELAGGRAWAMAEAERRLRLAEQALHPAIAPGEVRDELIALGRYVVQREK